MSRGSPFLALLTALLLVACGPSSSGARTPSVGFVHVSAITGDDVMGTGSPDLPFRTLTRGIAAASPGYIVKVAPGTYDASGGEIFPLRLKANVTVQGDASTLGAGSEPTVIDGVGTYVTSSFGGQSVAVVGASGAQLTGFRIHAAGGTAVWCEAEAMAVSANTIVDSKYGVVVAGSGGGAALLEGNDIEGNAVVGVATFGGAAPHLRRNVITGNGRGLAAAGTSQPDLGTADDPGSNTLVANVDCSLENATSNTLNALGNTWDEDVFLFNATSVCANGVPVANSSSGSVMYQYVPLSDAPIFPNAGSIATTAPKLGAIIATDRPSFAWVPTGAALAMLGVFTEPPTLSDGTIRNTPALVWVWHTGLGRGREGDVQFSDGASVSNGDLGTASEPVPLARGRTYYWAVWAWDTAGVHVVSSSPLLYFTIAN